MAFPASPERRLARLLLLVAVPASSAVRRAPSLHVPTHFVGDRTRLVSGCAAVVPEEPAAAEGAVSSAAAGASPPVGKRRRLLGLTRELQRLPRGTTPETVGGVLDQADWGTTPEQLTALMMVVHKAQRWRAAAMLADWAQHQELELSTMQYNLLISACARTRPRRALAIFRRMQESAAIPSASGSLALALPQTTTHCSHPPNSSLVPPDAGERRGVRRCLVQQRDRRRLALLESRARAAAATGSKVGPGLSPAPALAPLGSPEGAARSDAARERCLSVEALPPPIGDTSSPRLARLGLPPKTARGAARPHACCP